jgi:hypothetical protein
MRMSELHAEYKPEIMTEVMEPLRAMGVQLSAAQSFLLIDGLTADTAKALTVHIDTLTESRSRLTSTLHKALVFAEALETATGVKLPRYPEIGEYLGNTALCLPARDTTAHILQRDTPNTTNTMLSIPTRTPLQVHELPEKNLDSGKKTEAIGSPAEVIVEKANIFLGAGEKPIEEQLEFMQEFWSYLGYDTPSPDHFTEENIAALTTRLQDNPGSRIILSPLSFGFKQYINILNSEEAKSLVSSSLKTESKDDLAAVSLTAVDKDIIEKIGEEPKSSAGPIPGKNRSLVIVYNIGEGQGADLPLYVSFTEYCKKLKDAGLVCQAADGQYWALSTMRNFDVNYTDSEERQTAPRLEDTVGRVTTAMLLCVIDQRGTAYNPTADNLRCAITNVGIVDYILEKPSHYCDSHLLWDPNFKRTEFSTPMRNVAGRLSGQDYKNVRVWL